MTSIENIVVMINGKDVGKVSVESEASEADVLSEVVSGFELDGAIKKVSYVPGKIVNVVVG